ncbi:Kinetochore_protein Nuf2 [Hexamita inflata]|uniref:Kinetochore protein Nuf2 n=1 Tax=Hexamita inflata TaxID=28002 RepID=A0AA86UTL2_9EUKA|nr:Kinetochore protein Nuf2 [Hexamita inflata]
MNFPILQADELQLILDELSINVSPVIFTDPTVRDVSIVFNAFTSKIIHIKPPIQSSPEFKQIQLYNACKQIFRRMGLDFVHSDIENPSQFRFRAQLSALINLVRFKEYFQNIIVESSSQETAIIEQVYTDKKQTAQKLAVEVEIEHTEQINKLQSQFNATNEQFLIKVQQYKKNLAEIENKKNFGREQAAILKTMIAQNEKLQSVRHNTNLTQQQQTMFNIELLNRQLPIKQNQLDTIQAELDSLQVEIDQGVTLGKSLHQIYLDNKKADELKQTLNDLHQKILNIKNGVLTTKTEQTDNQEKATENPLQKTFESTQKLKNEAENEVNTLKNELKSIDTTAQEFFTAILDNKNEHKTKMEKLCERMNFLLKMFTAQQEEIKNAAEQFAKEEKETFK